MDKIFKKIAEELSIREAQVEATVKLIDDGNTIPFIARYRKEVTGNLSDETLRDLDERLKYLRNLETRKEEIIRLIDEQGKLTDELTVKIASTMVLSELEDIYRPFKPKKRTKATIAKEKGLEPLSQIIYLQMEKNSIYEIAKEYINEEKGVNNEDEAIAGALDIIAENIADDSDYRKRIKSFCFREAVIASKSSKEEEKSAYEMYYDYSEPILKMPSHRILAINRGEKEEFLKVKLEKPEDKIIDYLKKQVIRDYKSQFAEMLENTITDAWKRLIEPSIEREIRSDLTEKAEVQAIKVFGKNAKQLLMQPPIKNMTVMGFDPAYRTGCKIAVIDKTGKLLATTTVYPTEPQNDVEGSKKVLKDLIVKLQVNMIAIGNGTASRESEMFVSDMIKEIDGEIYYAIVSEAGASVYSSKLATEEYPDINVSLRGAISIARRLQDPLSELVKIDPKAIGVGQYQHDVNQKKLSESLTGVVEDAVNSVGVDVNTATPSLLSYVSGINMSIAKNIVKYRDENGELKLRKDLLKVPKLGPAAYKQCAGFIRIFDGKNPLEVTAVHPESYEVAEKLLTKLGYSVEILKEKSKLEEVKSALSKVDVSKTADELQVGTLTLKDIIEELSKPGRDPRESMPKPILRSDVLKFDDLQEGMLLTGTVRNVIDFGAFVDIGVKHDGLVHISEMADKFVRNPSEIVSVGDIVKVKVIGIDREKQKVKLSMKV